MFLTTIGVSLGRQPVLQKAYDEQVTFLTADFGKIKCYSFGSRSPKSLRGQILANFHWLDINLEKENNQYLLKSLSVHEKNPLLENLETANTYLEFLEILRKRLPFNEPLEDYYSHLRWLSTIKKGIDKKLWLEVLFYLGLLKIEGLYSVEEMPVAHLKDLMEYLEQCSEWNMETWDALQQIFKESGEVFLKNFVTYAKKMIATEL